MALNNTEIIFHRGSGEGTWFLSVPRDKWSAGAEVTVARRSGGVAHLRMGDWFEELPHDRLMVEFEDLDPKPARASKPAVRRSVVTRTGRVSRKRSCVTGGNCSSFGNGKSCGASDCDGWE